MRQAGVTLVVALAAGSMCAGERAWAGAPSSSDVEGAKVAVFGVVRDNRGAAIDGAVVTADFKVQKVKIVGRTDATGAYAIYKLGDDDNDDATVTCTKDNYHFVKEVPRHIDVKADQPAEIDCILVPK
jgi:hypothetical protein